MVYHYLLQCNIVLASQTCVVGHIDQAPSPSGSLSLARNCTALKFLRADTEDRTMVSLLGVRRVRVRVV